MQHSMHIPARPKYLVLSGAMMGLIMSVILTEDVGAKESSPAPSLSALREAVLANEAKASLIKMDYVYFFETIGDVPREVRFGGGSTKRGPGGRQASHAQCVYAQDGERSHSTVSYYEQKEWFTGTVDVITGEVHKMGRLPDLMWGRIDPIDSFAWSMVGPAGLGFRPFKNRYRLSQVLVPDYASVPAERTTIDGREAAVVQVQRPNNRAYYSLIWMDLERGMPLRIEHYVPNEQGTSHRRASVADSIKLHQLPNGGWIPVRGTRSLTVQRQGYEWTQVLRVVVDVNSISIDREDIPDSLFDIEFPPGAQVENGIVGALLPDGLRMDAIARAVMDETAEEMLASRTQPQVDSALSEESIASGADANEQAPVAGSEHQGALAGGGPAGNFPTPLVWLSICVFVLVFGATCIVYSLRHGRR